MNNYPILQENEEIRDVKGYEGLYAVTSYGRVWSYRSNKFLKPALSANGYCVVCFFVNHQNKTMYVHRLVAQAFLANPDNLPMINHKDECRTNNYIFNLEWCDAKYNNSYGTCRERAGKNIAKPVYCVELDAIFDSQKTAAEVVGLANSTGISMCCKGRRQTAAGYHWEYVS